VDHRYGVLHETGGIPVYAPLRWLAGQTEDRSNVTGREVPTRFWNDPIVDDNLPFVAVIGLHRSGSSCLAGVLHKLGVHMGDRLTGYEKTGGFEAVGLARLCEWAYPFPSTELHAAPEELRRALRRHIRWVQGSARSLRKIAGGKYPQLCAMGSELKEICGDALRVVHIQRPKEESIRSLQTRSRRASGRLHVDDRQAELVQEWLWQQKQAFLETTEHLTIHFRDLCADPLREIHRLTGYLKLQPSAEQIRTAAEHVNRELPQHFRTQEMDQG
jgi:hypothetical protein